MLRHFSFRTYLAGFLSVCLLALGQANEIPNGDFENGKGQWGLFVPPGMEDKVCTWKLSIENPHSGGTCGELRSEVTARYSLYSKHLIPVAAEERYRVVAWIRADANAAAQKSGPGIVIRLVLKNGKKDVKDSPAIFIGINGNASLEAMKRTLKFPGLTAPMPQEWTKIEAVVEIPKIEGGLDSMDFSIFGQFIQGTFYVDDISVEKVEADTPLTPMEDLYSRL